MVIDTQDATRRVTLAAQTPPEQLPQCPEFAWTAPLTVRQRQQLHDEAVEALAAPPDPELDWTVTDALASDLRVAKILMNRPEFVASLQPEWNVSDFWFYGPEWQAGEQEIEEDRTAGRHGTIYHSDEEFLAALHEWRGHNRADRAA